MGRWKLEYYSGGWVEFTGTVQEIAEELNGHEEATFKIPNTAGNRSFVSVTQIMRILFDGSQVFLGALLGAEYSVIEIKCIAYNGVYELLKRRVISGNFVNTPANVVAEAVRIAAGLINPLGSCPTTPITVNFDQTLCFDAIELIAKILNKDYWTENGDTLYIGTRGSAESFDGTIAKISTRGLDRAKKRDKVHFRGVDENGEQIMGVAGTGDDVAPFWCYNATTVATLNALAAQKLAEINSEDSGVSLTCPITSGIHLHPGDSITINKPALNLSGSYKIKRITKNRKTVDIEVSRQRKTTEDILEELADNDKEALNFVGQGFPFESWEDLIAKFGFFPKKGILWKDIWRYMPNIDKSLIPAADNAYDIGDPLEPLRWRAIYALHMFPSHLGPYSDDPAIVYFWTKNKAGTEIVDHQFVPFDDLHGVLGSATRRWYEANIGLARLDSLHIGAFEVITAARVLQNVTADVAIIASGKFPLARLPEGTAGYVLEAQGAGFDPMYVDPDNRYLPAGHDHAAGNITSGVLDEARIPTVFVNSRTFNGGITLGAALNMNSQDITNLDTINQVMPPGADQGKVGDTTTYWNCIAGNSVWYKALSQFDAFDDLKILRRLRTKGKDKNGLPLIDPKSLPPEITQNGLINAGNLTGLLIGAIKQLAAEVESLRKQIKGG
jgi:hypothetical protein